MGTLSVWKFPEATGADVALGTLSTLQKEGLIDVYDGAVVTWPTDAKKPKTHQLHSGAGAGALGGSFWGFLFGLIFFVPLIGMAVGAAMGGLTGSLAHVGIDEEFINEVRGQVTAGTSALFVVTGNAVVEKVHDAFRGQQAELIFTNLSKEQDETIRAVFADT